MADDEAVVVFASASCFLDSSEDEQNGTRRCIRRSHRPLLRDAWCPNANGSNLTALGCNLLSVGLSNAWCSTCYQITRQPSCVHRALVSNDFGLPWFTFQLELFTATSSAIIACLQLQAVYVYTIKNADLWVDLGFFIFSVGIRWISLPRARTAIG